MSMFDKLGPNIANAVEALGKSMTTLGVEKLDDSPIIKAIMTPTSSIIPGMDEGKGR
ncbi:MAG: hypothetical protein K2Q01_11955 [Rickettsiales bacterium]|nr:hypothetical protein [Rickettsiales bacterium]